MYYTLHRLYNNMYIDDKQDTPVLENVRLNPFFQISHPYFKADL